MKREIVVGSRGSKLALIQTESVINLLRENNPNLGIGINTFVTTGDRDRFTHLNDIGTDVFVKELEEALINGKIDLAVHSLKDVPTDVPRGLELVAVTPREDPRDVLVAKASLDRLHCGARIGTGSLRRSIQITQVRPDIEICSIRGNVDTRLRKVSTGEVDGIITAAAALIRLGWQERITQYLSPDSFLPAAGQGALVIEARSDDKDIIDLVLPINHLPTWYSTTAERAFLQKLGGGCRAPVAALGTTSENRLKLEGMVASPGLKKALRLSIEGDIDAAEDLGEKLAKKMMMAGASGFIAEARRGGVR